MTSHVQQIKLIFFLTFYLTGCNTRTSPSAAGNTKLFEHGTGVSYQLTTSVVLNDPAERKGKEVGYQVQSDVVVGVVWQGEEDKYEKLLEVEVNSPRLLIKSQKAQTPEGFNIHKSQLDTLKNFPFLIHWKNGEVLNTYLDEREDGSMVNYKKGVASLFQFQVLDLETEETDASGHCKVLYKSLDQFSFNKTKTNCHQSDKLKVSKASDPVLSPRLTSHRTSTYKISPDLTTLESVSAFEHHDIKMLIRKEIGSSIASTQTLTMSGKTSKVKILTSNNLESAIREFEKTRTIKTTKHSLHLDVFVPKCDKDCPSLPKLLKENRNHLTTSSLGTVKSANAFVKLVSVGRSSTKEELAKAFKGTKNKEILTQLCDLAGAIQLPESHEVMMKIINFDAEDDLENSERYLWSLAAGSHPQESTIRDLYKISQRPHPNEKLSETLILTLCTMTHKFAKLGRRNPLVREVTESMLGELKLCADENCKLKYLRGLRNLKCPTTVPTLLHYALTEKRRPSVEAMKALRSFESSHWSGEVIDAAQRIYYQAGRKYDSSSRTLALDILLESNPRREVLEELLLSLGEYDKVYEVKQYLVQRVRQISAKNPEFGQTVASITRKHPILYKNYNTLAQRGLSTTFARDFANDEHRNGSLVTVLEISKGLLKRGFVDVVIEAPEKASNLFRLGLFAGGLSSFVSSDEEEANDNEEEVATAGMELSVLGSNIRPFVFFNGQGELMGHVWSGTASEKTPAYQALILAVDVEEFIPLQTGFVAQMEIYGGVSLDLSGQIQISLWNRNAHSLVEKNAGISLQGRVKLDASFVRSKIEFNTATQVQLNLQSDVNFYSGTALCMQLSQPEVIIKQSFHKTEMIPGEKHRLRRSKYTQVKVPGRTYALNKKNDEICSSIFSD